MSVCLVITKSIAVSSLGLYAGLLTTSSVVSASNYMGKIVSTFDLVSLANLKSLIKSITNVSTGLGIISSLFFGFSYFGAPMYMRHPYLIYGMVASPLASLYLKLVSLKFDKDNEKLNSGDHESIKLQDLDNSVVDLGKNATASPTQSVPTTIAPVQLTAGFTKHLLISSGITMLGFIQSVVGLNGENQFT